MGSFGQASKSMAVSAIILASIIDVLFESVIIIFDAVVSGTSGFEASASCHTNCCQSLVRGTHWPLHSAITSQCSLTATSRINPIANRTDSKQTHWNICKSNQSLSADWRGVASSTLVFMGLIFEPVFHVRAQNSTLPIIPYSGGHKTRLAISQAKIICWGVCRLAHSFRSNLEAHHWWLDPGCLIGL